MSADLFNVPTPPPAPPPDDRRARPRSHRHQRPTSWRYDPALAFRVSRLQQRQYDVYRLIALYGPASDAVLQQRAHNHGVHQKPAELLERRAELVTLGLLEAAGTKESPVWQQVPHRVPR